MEKNDITTEYEETTVIRDTEDPNVKAFVDLVSEERMSSRRCKKMNKIRNNIKIIESVSDLGDDALNSIDPIMECSLIYKLLKVFDMEVSDMPKVKPSMTGIKVPVFNIIDEMKDRAFNEIGMKDVFRDIIGNFKTDGSVIAQVAEDGGIEVCDLSELYFDSSKKEITSNSKRRGKNIKTIVRSVTLSYSEFCSEFPEWRGKVMMGSPIDAEETDVFNTDKLVEDDQNVTMLYCYSIQGKEPVSMIIAGSSCTIIDEQIGADYPFVRKERKEDTPYLPFVDFHFSPIRDGFFSPSILDMAKDMISAYQKLLNIALPSFSRTANPALLLFGDIDARSQEELQFYSESASQGETHMIQLGTDARVQEMNAGGVAQELERLRNIIIQDLSMRFEINFQALEQVEQTATEFVGKGKTEAKSIVGVYKMVRSPLSRLTKYVTSIYINENEDGELLEVSGISEEDDIQIEYITAVEVVKDWGGEFEVEVDLKSPVSTQDKALAINELEQTLRNTFYAVPFKSVEEIELEIQLFYAKASLRDLDNVFTLPLIRKKARLLVEGREAERMEAMQQQMPPQGQEEAPLDPEKQETPESGTPNQEAMRELAPNAFS